MTPDNRNLIKNRDQMFWGQILTPSSFASPHNLALRWCGDNEMYTWRYRFWRFYRWLWKMRPARKNCVFINAPDWLKILPNENVFVDEALKPFYKIPLFFTPKDVIGSAWRTWLRYWQHFWIIKLLGFPVAYVAQDGAEKWPIPPFCNAVFIGGSTKWKMSPAADSVIRRAQRRGLWVHVGRVNSQKRIRHFKLVGVDSVDGTSLTYAPDRDFWVFQSALLQPVLFQLED